MLFEEFCYNERKKEFFFSFVYVWLFFCFIDCIAQCVTFKLELLLFFIRSRWDHMEIHYRYVFYWLMWGKYCFFFRSYVNLLTTTNSQFQRFLQDVKTEKGAHKCDLKWNNEKKTSKTKFFLITFEHLVGFVFLLYLFSLTESMLHGKFWVSEWSLAYISS